MDKLVANLVAAIEPADRDARWMDDATRAEAAKKLATFDPRVGYPLNGATTRPMHRTAASSSRSRNGRGFDWNRDVARLDEPVDRDEWGMNPQTVNAYYNPLVNQITFPAAILQPPFFDPYADPAVNYGAIGAVIGHEIGHGYDDQGASSMRRAGSATGGRPRPTSDSTRPSTNSPNSTTRSARSKARA